MGAPERVEWHLHNWARWMRSGSHVGAYGAVAVGLSSGGRSEDFDDMADASERRSARIVDTVVYDLPSDERMAICHAYLGAVVRFRRQVMAEVLARAKRAVGRGLAARGVY